MAEQSYELMHKDDVVASLQLDDLSGAILKVTPSASPELLPLGAKIITTELGARFLKDYLDGDVYFKIDRPSQNLDRCRAQLRLAADMEEKWPELQRILQEAAASRCRTE